MERESLIEKCRELGPWFHQIDLGDGVFTRSISASPGPQPLEHPQNRWLKIKDVLPADMSGMRILDIGCSDGFFSIEMHRRGAANIVCIDAAKKAVERLTWLKQQLALPNIEARAGNIYSLDKNIGKFDFVFMFALLYHLKEPLLGLEMLAPLSDILFLETSAIDDEKHPYLELVPPIEGVTRMPKWIPTTRCVKDMLHWVGYDVVIEVAGPEDRRPIYIAYKKHADMSRWRLPKSTPSRARKLWRKLAFKWQKWMKPT